MLFFRSRSESDRRDRPLFHRRHVTGEKTAKMESASD
jgi:hypothetical protein